MPVVTGHEIFDIVVALGADVQSLRLGQQVTADSTELCGHGHYCQKGTCSITKIMRLMAFIVSWVD